MISASLSMCKKKQNSNGGRHNLSTDDKQRHSTLINTKTAVIAQLDNHFR
jgi:hypothetical protein